MRLLLSNPGNHLPALSYARTALRPFYSAHTAEFQRLTACITYLPLSRLRSSPYADLASPSLHLDLEPLFAKEYCASLGMSRQVPLRVVGDIGGGGALAKIEKGRKVMRERKSEWSQTSELPVSFSRDCVFWYQPNELTSCMFRLKSHYPRRTDITQYLPVLSLRSKRQNRIRP